MEVLGLNVDSNLDRNSYHKSYKYTGASYRWNTTNGLGKSNWRQYKRLLC
jgi:hypothetical protein